MPREGALRQDPLREARGTIDTGSGVKRMGTEQRQEHLGRGTFINFYKDLGISTTPQGAKLIREDEKKHKDYLGSLSGNIATNQEYYDLNKKARDSNQELYNTTNTDYNTLRGTYDDYIEQSLTSTGDYKSPDWDGWRRAEEARGYGTGDYKRVTLLNKGGNSSHGTWILAGTAADSLKTNDNYWVGGNSNHIQVQMKHQSQLQGTADMLQGSRDAFYGLLQQAYWDADDDAALAAQTNARAAYANAAVSLEEPLGILLSNRGIYQGAISTNQGYMDDNTSMINSETGRRDAAKLGREKEWDDIYMKQERKRNSMAEFFNSLDLGV